MKPYIFHPFEKRTRLALFKNIQKLFVQNIITYRRSDENVLTFMISEQGIPSLICVEISLQEDLSCQVKFTCRLDLKKATIWSVDVILCSSGTIVLFGDAFGSFHICHYSCSFNIYLNMKMEKRIKYSQYLT